MQIDRRLISHFDWSLFGLALALALLGVATIYSATQGTAEGHLALKQFYWLCMGLVALFAAVVVDYHHLNRYAYPFYVAVLLLLVLVEILGTTGRGSQRWLNLGFFALQPSELAKLAIVMVLAKHFQYDEPPDGHCLRDLRAPFLLLMPLLGLILVQPDLGTAIIVVVVFTSVVLLVGLRLRSLFYLAVTGIGGLPVAWQFLKPYQRRRVLTFLNPDLDPLGAGYHVIQSQISIGSGGWLGKGYLRGSQSRLGFLPEQHTDFVFSVFAEEWGFIGCLILLGLYFALIFLSLKGVVRAKDRFGRMLGLGVITIIFWQVLINVAMVTGLLPVVGITLPLLSYGGSSLVTLMIGVGFLINVSMRRYTF